MLSGRSSIALATSLAIASCFAPSTDAGLCSCLFGRRADPVVVGYAPQPVYAAGYAAVPVAPAPLPTNGAVQVQRPAYIDNPSVYTGRPVITAPSAQTLYRVPVTGTLPSAVPLPQVSASRVPIAQTLRGAQMPLVSPGTVVTSNYQAAYPGTAIAPAPGFPTTTTTPVGTPPSAMPATQVVPQFAPAPQPRQSGLGRFFGSILGTDYGTSYYQAPVTYYRPVTTVDPVTGAVVTVQQPCTSTVQQLQRTPYTSLQHSPGVLTTPTTSCPTPGCQTAQPYAIQPYAGSATVAPTFGTAPLPQANGIGQVGGIAAPGSNSIAPIGSSPAPMGSAPAPMTNLQAAPPSGSNVAPLTGAPPAQGDLAPIVRPELQPAPSQRMLRQETSQPQPDPSPSNPPGSYWDSPEAQNSTAQVAPSSSQPPRLPDPKALATPQFTGLEPIPAPDGYESPFRRRGGNSNQVQPTNDTQAFEAPPLLPDNGDNLADASHTSTRVSVPVRDASLTRNHRWDPLTPAGTPPSVSALQAPSNNVQSGHATEVHWNDRRRANTHPSAAAQSNANSGWYTVQP